MEHTKINTEIVDYKDYTIWERNISDKKKFVTAYKVFSYGCYDWIFNGKSFDNMKTIIDNRTDNDIIIDHYTFLLNNTNNDKFIATSLIYYKEENDITNAIRFLSQFDETEHTICINKYKSLINHLKRIQERNL